MGHTQDVTADALGRCIATWNRVEGDLHGLVVHSLGIAMLLEIERVHKLEIHLRTHEVMRVPIPILAERHL